MCIIKIRGKRVVGKAENKPAHSGPTILAMPVTNRIIEVAMTILTNKILLLNLTLSCIFTFSIFLNKKENSGMNIIGIIKAVKIVKLNCFNTSIVIKYPKIAINEVNKISSFLFLNWNLIYNKRKTCI